MGRNSGHRLDSVWDGADCRSSLARKVPKNSFRSAAPAMLAQKETRPPCWRPGGMPNFYKCSSKSGDRSGPSGRFAPGLGVLDQCPSYGLAVVWRHCVALGDRSRRGRLGSHLPDSALGARFSSACGRTQRLSVVLSHLTLLKKRNTEQKTWPTSD